MVKKRQYYIWQYKLEYKSEGDNKLMIDFDEVDSINSGEMLMLL